MYMELAIQFGGYYTNYTIQILVPIDYTMADRQHHWIPIANTCAYNTMDTQLHYTTMHYDVSARWVHSELTTSYPLCATVTQHAHSLYILPMSTHHQIHTAFEEVVHWGTQNTTFWSNNWLRYTHRKSLH